MTIIPKQLFTAILVCGLCFSAAAQTTDASTDAKIKALEQKLADLQKQLADLKTPAATPAAPAATAPAAAPSKASGIGEILGPVTLSGFVDTYYMYNANTPASRTAGLRSFDANSGQFALNMVELVIDKAPDAAASRTGYHVAVGYGQAMDAMYASVPVQTEFDKYLKEAYFSYLAPVGKGLQIDVGKFVTPAGAEVIETKDNWNYSRGILFSYAIPYNHFGARAKYTFNDKFSLTGYLVNGWNNVIDNNSGKTIGFSAAFNPTKKLSIIENYLAGPEIADSNAKWRQLSDTVVTYSATPKLSLMANYDYGRDGMVGFAKPVYWTGIAGYAKYAFNDKYAVAGRYEYFNDHDGFTTLTAQHFNGVTGTFQRVFAKNIISRVEVRRDMSNRSTFARGTNETVKNQTTAALGLVYTFATKE